MNLLLKIISANDKWDGFTIVITTNVISNTHKYVICIYMTHTNYSYHTIIQTFVFWKSVKGILSCSLSFKRVHYQCLPKSLCLCSKRLSLLCFKRIISCPYKSTIIFTLTQKTFTPACKMVLPNYLKMVGLFWPWILNYFYATESDTDGRQSIKIIYKLKVNIWQKSNGMKNRDKGVGQGIKIALNI